MFSCDDEPIVGPSDCILLNEHSGFCCWAFSLIVRRREMKLIIRVHDGEWTALYRLKYDLSLIVN